jgi:hypothetical protein
MLSQKQRAVRKRIGDLMGIALLLVFAAAMLAPASLTAQPTTRQTRNGQRAIGYRRGMGLGNIGLEGQWLPGIGKVGVALAVMALVEQGDKGIAVVPCVLWKMHQHHQSRFFLSAGLQLIYKQFGNIGVHGVGGDVSVGYEYQFEFGLGIYAGVGINSVQKLVGVRDNVRVLQPSVISPHGDFGLRYWF